MKTIFYILLSVTIISWLLTIFLKKQNKKSFMMILTCLLVLGSSIIGFKELFPKLNYGLDLQGGFEILYQVTPIDEKDTINKDMVFSTYKTILKRVDVLGVSEPEITIEGEDRIRIKLAGITNEEEAKQVLSSTASLTFRDVYDKLLMTSDVLGGSVKTSTDEKGRPAVSLPVKDIDAFYNVTSKVKDMTDNRIVIWLDFDETEDSFKKEETKCGSLETSKCLSAATVNEAFAGDVIISGSFTLEEAKNLASLINSGAMPTKLNELSSRTVPASFGENSLNKTLTAGLIGVIIVVLIMTIIYHLSGFIASICLILYSTVTFLIFDLIGGVLTLPGIAAMLLGIGMAVDSAVISFERVKEELKSGKDLEKATINGNKQSLSSIIDANITTIIVAIILFIFGESSIKGFATMLIISIIATLLIMVVVLRYIMIVISKSNYFKNKLNFLIGLTKKGLKKNKKPFEKLKIVKSSKYFIALACIVILVGLLFSITKGVNLGVDFKGGTSVTINTSEEETVNEVEKYLKENYKIEKTESYQDITSILINEQLNQTKIDEINNHLEETYQVETDTYVVSDTVKKELTKNGIYSLIIASIGIVLYVSIRFKFSYAISGIIALIHDVLVTIAFFVIFGIEINSIFIAAILTIIGYSINDTIVTFDRVRDNAKKLSKKDAENKEKVMELVDVSIKETLYRTILTTLTTIVPVTCLMLFGAYEIFNFNIALFIGFIAGVYSSIFISNYIWALLEKRRVNKKPKKKDIDDEPEELLVKGINY